MAYSFSLTTFSNSGKLVQLEHALNAVNTGVPALGIKAKNGVVIATEKKMLSILADETSIKKVEPFSPSIGAVAAGLVPDYRVVLRTGRKAAQTYKLQYGEDIPVLELVKTIAEAMQEKTQSGGVRPFGVSLLVAGYDHNGPQLYQVDPSGIYFGWKASAIGRDMENAKAFLERRYTDTMELEDAIHTAILTLKENFEGEMTQHNIEIGVVGENGVFRSLTAEEIADYLNEVE
eukprot:GDKJ01056303.1.p1 GENE.GDKJ01056303.1~~GDKJ01056303.1.p1  ORF type:complete len:233 (+),score=62.34 GDKJ01056303.1:29-727(+)